MDELNEQTLPILSIAVLGFVGVMGLMYGAAMMTNIGVDTGNEQLSLSLFNQLNMWVISILSLLVIMVIAIGFNKIKPK